MPAPAAQHTNPASGILLEARGVGKFFGSRLVLREVSVCALALELNQKAPHAQKPPSGPCASRPTLV